MEAIDLHLLNLQLAASAQLVGFAEAIFTPAVPIQVVLVGPHASSTEHLLGNYYDKVSGDVISPLEAFTVSLHYAAAKISVKMPWW